MALAVLAVLAGLAASFAQAQHHGHARRTGPCGCGWSNQGACGISTQQIVRSLTKSKIDDLCNKTHNEGDPLKTTDDIRSNKTMLDHASRITHYECTSRQKIRNKLASYQKCEGLTSGKCIENKECQMGAQSAGKCGIDESNLILDLVGEEHHSHPLVKIVNASGQCKERSEQNCEADPACKFNRFHCDMKEEFFFGQAIAHPQILLLLELLEANSYCHFFDEAYNYCGHFCREEAGICRFNASKLTDYTRRETQRLIHVMCRPTGNRTECASPCVDMNGTCGAPPDLATDMHHTQLTYADWKIFGLMLQLESSTAMIERRCNFFDSNKTLCLNHTESCEIHHFQSWVTTTTTYAGPPTTKMWTTTEYGYTPARTTSTLSDSSPFGQGVDGIVGRLIGSYESGELTEKFEAIAKSNPEVIDELREIWKKSRQPEETEPKVDDDDESMMGEPVMLIAGAFLLFGCGVAMMSWSCGMVCGRGYRRSEARALLQAGDGSTADYERGAGQ